MTPFLCPAPEARYTGGRGEESCARRARSRVTMKHAAHDHAHSGSPHGPRVATARAVGAAHAFAMVLSVAALALAPAEAGAEPAKVGVAAPGEVASTDPGSALSLEEVAKVIAAATDTTGEPQKRALEAVGKLGQDAVPGLGSARAASARAAGRRVRRDRRERGERWPHLRGGRRFRRRPAARAEERRRRVQGDARHGPLPARAREDWVDARAQARRAGRG